MSQLIFNMDFPLIAGTHHILLANLIPIHQLPHGRVSIYSHFSEHVSEYT